MFDIEKSTLILGMQYVRDVLTTIIIPIWLKRSFLKDKDTNLMPQHSSNS
jgi:hypothetical protein